ncbi:MAG: hypothetical protein U5K75_03005 [Ahrensia sp.]|nr:hypothetical protein [Ahrensia sp.]
MPKKTIAILHKLLKGKKTPDVVAVQLRDTRVCFDFELDGLAVTIMSKLIDGTFPDYNRVIPKCNDKIADFDVATFGEALRAVSLVASQKGRAVKLELANNAAQLTVSNPDAGTANATIECCYNSPEFTIGFNSQYMAELIAVACPDGGVLTAAFDDARSPTVFTGSIEGWTGVLMPMRV